MLIFLLKFGTSRSNSLPNEALLCKTLCMHTVSEPMVCQLRASILSVALSPMESIDLGLHMILELNFELASSCSAIACDGLLLLKGCNHSSLTAKIS